MKPAKTLPAYQHRRLLVQSLFALLIPLALAEFIETFLYVLLSVASSIVGSGIHNLAFLYGHYVLILRYFVPLYSIACIIVALSSFFLKKYLTVHVVAVIVVAAWLFSMLLGIDWFPENNTLFSIKQFISSFVW